MCDYCNNISTMRIRIHNHIWDLCLQCLIKNKDRFDITDKQITKLVNEYRKYMDTSKDKH